MRIRIFSTGPETGWPWGGQLLNDLRYSRNPSIFDHGEERLEHAALHRQPVPVQRNGKRPHVHPVGHVRLAVVLIGAMSLALAAGLEMIGALARFNAIAAKLASRGGAESFPKELPGWLVWIAAALAAFGMAAAVLQTPGMPRRVLLWLTAIMLVAAWAPVLGLAARHPDIAAPWIATVWSGVCAMFYASRHRLPCDEIFSETT